MVPTKFASVRYKANPGVTAAFRDDTNLKAFRYEKTVASEPPIPILPTRNPLRTTRPHSSLATTPNRPIIVTPPLLEPPTEEHPALRETSFFATRDDERKRDSGLAPNSPSSTLRDEGDDYLLRYKKNDEGLKSQENALFVQVELADKPSLNERARLATPPRLNDRGDTAFTRPTNGSRVAAKDIIPEEDGSCPSSPASSKGMSRSSTIAGQSTPPRRFLRRSFSLRSVTSPSLWKQSSSLSEVDSTSGTVSPAALANSALPPLQAPMAPLQPLPGAGTETEEPRSPSRLWLPFSAKSPKTQAPTGADTDLLDGTDDTLFSPLTTPIPTDNLLEDDFITQLSFSNRGSILFGGHRTIGLDEIMESRSASDTRDDHNRNGGTSASASTPTIAPNNASTSSAATSATQSASPRQTQLAPAFSPTPNIYVLPAEVEKESEKVRSFYAAGEELRWEDGAPAHAFQEQLAPTLEAPDEEDELDAARMRPVPAPATPRSGSVYSQHRDNARKETELAGGIEDWEDIDGANVDRYGFIEPPRIGSRPGSRIGSPGSMSSVQFSPRRRNVLQKREPTDLSSASGGKRGPKRQVSRRSLNTQHSGMSTTSLRSSRSVMRQAGNLLPHNRDRRWMDEAGDMLTTAPSLQDIAEEAKLERISEALKRKEWERSEKWRKMAKNVKKGTQGEGMDFEFDVKNPKLIERTWKGIPDRWRGAAWWSFMAENAKAHDASPTEDSIVADFHRLQQRASPDDVQIDLDVPRTINRHIMFRRRYRGGQRLMFRVLHALSLYFPETGYVQGMASLAATLLCYFDEEKSFVMLVRMWQLRGLEYLYRPGFEGLMAALKDFDDNWLQKDVAQRLNDLCIDNTAYGTRWYLTLFNLSIPFAAQLRVWDVFLLLGDGSANNNTTAPIANPSSTAAPPAGLDVLHATSAALIQALREVLLDSDFENCMKALTSWIPIKDEDMLMKVTKAEWKAHQNRRKA